PGGAHRHGERLAVYPDLQRLLGREQVGPVLRDPVDRNLEHPPPGRRTAHSPETTVRPRIEVSGAVLGIASAIILLTVNSMSHVRWLLLAPIVAVLVIDQVLRYRDRHRAPAEPA